MRINAFFEGGGILGVAFAGAYKALSERGYQVARCAGISVGSIISTLILSGYSANELINIINYTDFSQFKAETKKVNTKYLSKPISAIYNKGLYNSEVIEEWMNKMLHRKGFNDFEDFMFGGESSLKIIAANISNRKMLVLPDDLPSYGLDPYYFSVAKAVRMSCSIPFYYTPVDLESRNGCNKIVDGGVVRNIPTNIISKSKHFKYPTFRFKIKNNSIISKINEKININIINGSVSNCEEADHTIIIENDRLIKATDFDIRKEEIIHLYKQGYKATVKYLNQLNNY